MCLWSMLFGAFLILSLEVGAVIYVVRSNAYIFKPRPPLRKRIADWWRRRRRQ